MSGKKQFGNQTSKEKAVVVYMTLAKRYKENRDAIKYGIFSNQWDDMFKEDKCGEARDMKIQAFKYARSNFDDKSYAEIKAIRDKFMIYPSREVPVELKQLAQSKCVVIMLAPNIDKHLSGFNVTFKEGNMTHKINEIPYGLSESEAKILLESIPEKETLIDKESRLMYVLETQPPSKSTVRCVNKYKAPYATHKFKVFMNKFTIHKCKDKELTNACVLLCNRVGINNLSNEAPILYKFCEGSGQREKNLKRIRNQRKGNKKAAKKRKR